jgi:zinc transport system substrate-binding protein
MRKLTLIIMLLIPGLGIAEPVRVFVSVLPLKTFVEKIGGNHVTVHTMVKPGYSPHTYDPTPRQIMALAKADLYVSAGVPFEKAWVRRIRAANPRMRMVEAGAGIDMLPAGNHGHHHGEVNGGHQDASGHDPHIWTSPPLAKQIVTNIRDALTTLDPANRPQYASNTDALLLELDALDRDLRAQLKNLGNRKFMVFHPAWGYFADAYGLIQIPIEKEGKEPGARALTLLIGQARREHVKVIFVQPQFDRKSATQVARAIGGRVVAIDPLAPDYMNNLRGVARQISEANIQ